MRPEGVADAQTVEIPSPPKELSMGTHLKCRSRELVPVEIEGNKVPKSGMDRGEKSCATENIVVIASNREDLLKLTIENNVKLLILTSGFVLNKELRQLAEKHNVSVISSPYSTSPTSMLIAYSMPVSVIADKDILPVHPNDSISKIQSTLKLSPCRYLPVVDEN